MDVKYYEWLGQSVIVFLGLNETNMVFDNGVTILYSYEQFIVVNSSIFLAILFPVFYVLYFCALL